MKPEPRRTRRKTERPETVTSSEVATVTVTAENIMDEDGNDRWKNKVNLAGHCAICLLEKCRGSQNNDNEPGLTTIWNCLPFPKTGTEKGNGRRQSLPPPWTRNLIFLEKGSNSESKSPQLCVQCLEQVKFLVNLKQELTEIKKKIENHEKRLEETLKFSKERCLSELVRSLEGKADLPEMCFENTMKFIEMIHGGLSRVVHRDQTPQTQKTVETSGHTLIVTQLNPQNTDVIQCQSKSGILDNGDIDMEIGSDAEPESIADDVGDSNQDQAEKCTPREEPTKPIEVIDIDDDDEDNDCVQVQAPSATGISISLSSDDESSDSEFEGQLMEVVLENGPSSSSKLTPSKKTVAVIVKSATKITPPVIPEHLKRARCQYSSRLSRLCRVCRENVDGPLYYEHMRGHVGDYATKCVNPNCFHVFVSQAHLEMNHLGRTSKFPKCAAIAAEREKIKCYVCPVDNCDFKWDNYNSCRKHLGRHETQEKNFTCPLEKCGETFTIRKNVEYHLMEAHTFRSGRAKPDAVDCQKCDQCLKQIPFSEIVNHLWTTHQVLAEDQISCETCPRKFSQRLKFIEHVASSHKVEGFNCDICKNNGLRFFVGAKFREHYFSNHGVEARFKCDRDQCQFTSFRKDVLKEHKTLEHPRPGKTPNKNKRKAPTKRHKCDHCEKMFINSSMLTSHLIMKHGAPPLNCRFCEKTFNSEQLLSRHEKADHLGVTFAKFRCSYENCDKSFNARRHLTRHVRGDHLNIRIKCDFCDQTYRDDAGILRHKKLQHPEEFAKISGYVPEVYMCDECGRSFKLKKMLQQHKLIHTGERPYTCELCGSQFRHNSSLYTHRKSHEKQGSNFKVHKTFDRDLNRRKIPDSS